MRAAGSISRPQDGEDGIQIFAKPRSRSPMRQSPQRQRAGEKAPEYMLVKSNGQEIDLTHFEVLIGRSPMATVCVEHHSIAREHATITFKPIMVQPTLQYVNFYLKGLFKVVYLT